MTSVTKGARNTTASAERRAGEPCLHGFYCVRSIDLRFRGYISRHRSNTLFILKKLFHKNIETETGEIVNNMLMAKILLGTFFGVLSENNII